MPLTESEAGHFRKLIDLCGDLLSNRVCNDFPVPNTDENWELYVRMCKADNELEEIGPRPPVGDRIWFMDWMLLRYLADRMTSEAPKREA